MPFHFLISMNINKIMNIHFFELGHKAYDT